MWLQPLLRGLQPPAPGMSAKAQPTGFDDPRRESAGWTHNDRSLAAAHHI